VVVIERFLNAAVDVRHARRELTAVERHRTRARTRRRPGWTSPMRRRSTGI